MLTDKQILFLIFVTLWSSYVDEVWGLHCLSCAGVSQPRHCHDLEECSAGQHCAVEKLIDQYKDVYYNVGCMDIKQCNANHTLAHGISTVQCVECCENDLCNSNLCGAPGYPNRTGPICYSCKSMPRDRKCRKMEICQENELCFHQQYEEFGDVLIDTGCSTHQGCEALTSGSNFDAGAIVGKRSDTPRSLTRARCSSCCDKQICNEYCHGARDCLEIKTVRPSAHTGPYSITLRNKTVTVWCDMTTEGGGWTVFQNRYDGSVDFYRAFSEYTDGFGAIDGEFWLGLENVYQLTVGLSNSLRVDIVGYKGRSIYAQLSSFNIGAGPAFTLHVGGTETGTAGNELLLYDGRRFTTKDMDQDRRSNENCAVSYHGAFWYDSCYTYMNPNGKYSPGLTSDNFELMTYTDRHGCKAIQMKFRRND